MPLEATTPVTIPETTYGLWGLERFEYALRAGGKFDVAAGLRRCNAAGWSGLPEHARYLRYPDLVTTLTGLAQAGNAAAARALSDLQLVQDTLLSVAGVLMDAEGVR